MSGKNVGSGKTEGYFTIISEKHLPLQVDERMEKYSKGLNSSLLKTGEYIVLDVRGGMYFKKKSSDVESNWIYWGSSHGSKVNSASLLFFQASCIFLLSFCQRMYFPCHRNGA